MTNFLQFNDDVYESRHNSHKAIEMLAHTSNGQEGIVEAGLVPILVEKLLEETDEIKVNEKLICVNISLVSICC